MEFTQIVSTLMIAYMIQLTSSESPKLKVELIGTGFHRELKYSLKWNERENREFAVKQTLPASIYVNVDQLDEFRRHRKLNYFTEKHFIDVEATTEDSESFIILLYGTTNVDNVIELPVHYRYHAPGNKSFVTVNIDYPQLFLESTEIDSDYALNVRMTCSNHNEDCQWTEVQYDNYSNKPLKANIPIGNAQMSGVITFCTIALSWIAAIYILYVIHGKQEFLRKKLK